MGRIDPRDNSRALVTIFALATFLAIPSVGQQPNSPLRVPKEAVVTTGPAHELEPGDIFSFQLKFDPPPDGYGGGEIGYHFAEVGADLQCCHGPGAPIMETGGEVPLQDGISTYNLSFPIAVRMIPGTWELREVTLGRAAQKPVSLAGRVTFDIAPPPPVHISLEAGQTVRAGGESLTVKIHIMDPPTVVDKRCQLSVSASLSPEDPAQRDQRAIFQGPSIRVQPDKNDYQIAASFLPDTPPGKWRGQVSVWLNDYEHCRQPSVLGNSGFEFAVTPALGLVTPTSVRVTANPSQVELLLGEAERLRMKVQHLKEQLTPDNMTANQLLLRNGLLEAANDVDKTEDAYKNRGEDHSSTQIVDAFFDEIRLDYSDALKAIGKESAQLQSPSPRLITVGAPRAGSRPNLTVVSAATLKTILHTAKAYDIVATTKTMTFSLEVYSVPDGATISYRQRNQEYHFVDHETDWRIENLARGVYFIRVQKPGFEDNEIPFDAMDNTSTSIKIPLKRKRGTR